MTYTMKKTFYLCSLLLSLYGPQLAAQNAGTPDPYLAQAFDGIWQMERNATHMLTEQVHTHVVDDTFRQEPQHKNAPVYLRESGDTGAIEYRKKRYPVGDTPWGGLPHLDPDTMRLLDITMEQTNYLVLSGLGEGIFSTTNWKQYRFLHVLDVGRGRGIVNYYPLFADAGLGEQVLGRLPGSNYLNYARLVPTDWNFERQATRYEILLYELGRNGIKRVIKNDAPLSYVLQKNTNAPQWELTLTAETPVADRLDDQGHYFTAARLSREQYQNLYGKKSR